jgi:hypothetical protein
LNHELTSECCIFGTLNPNLNTNTMAGTSLIAKQNTRPLVVLPAFVLLCELETSHDVLILNSFYITIETNRVEQTMCSACRGVNAECSTNVSAVTTGVLATAAITVFGHHLQPTTFGLSLKARVVLAMSDSVLDGAPVPACQLRQVVAVDA